MVFFRVSFFLIKTFIEIKFIHHAIYPFKVQNSLFFWYTHRVIQPSPQLILEHFYHSPNKNSEPLNYHLPMPAL